MQVLKNIRPIFLDTDSDELAVDRGGSPILSSDRARYLKNYRISFNRNSNTPQGTGDGKPSGANFGAGTKLISTSEVVITRPEGFNKVVGSFEAKEINKLFYCNYNSKGLHGVYMIDGDTMQAFIVAIDPVWNFSLDPQFACTGFHYRLSYNSDGTIKEIHLTFSDGLNWQRWINVYAAIRTDGFDTVKYPYFNAVGPHNDRACMFDYPTRPAMFCPRTQAIPYDATRDANKANKLLKSSIQFAQQFIYTDGRTTTLSQWSSPYSVKQAQCNASAQGLSRGARITLDAGCAQVEAVRLLFKKCGGDWFLYDTIKKFSDCGANSPALIGQDYWKRTGPWEDYSYDPQTNTIQYDFFGDRDFKLFSQEDARMLWNQIPISSIASTSVGDEVLMGNNKYDYDNFTCELLSKFKLKVAERTDTACVPKRVSIKAYSFLSRDATQCQVAYRLTADGDVYFGGLKYIPIAGGNVTVDNDEAKEFELTFGKQEGPLAYLAGTAYFSIGKQYKVNKDGSMELVGVLDFSRQDQKDFVRDTFFAGGYFIFLHEFKSVPADKYICRLARHNFDATLGGYENTSTYVIGIANSKGKSPVQPNIFQSSISVYAKEMEIDASAGSVDVWRNGKDLFYIFVPYDFVEDGLLGIKNRRWRFIEGYVRETSDNNRGVELLLYDTDSGQNEYKRSGRYTDHNGFYFAYTAKSGAKEAIVFFKGKFNCQNTGFEIFRNRDLPQKDRGWYKDQTIFVDEKNGGKFGDCNRVLVRGKAVSCDDGAPLAGIAITITRGGTTYTANDGSFELVVHNSYEGVRQDRIYFNASGLCQFAACDCSQIPVENYSDAGMACVNCTQRLYPFLVNRRFKVLSANEKALKGGGRFGIGINGWDLAGRGTYVNLLDYADIPTFLEKGRFSPSILSWFATGVVRFPTDIKYISFFRTDNLLLKGSQQWVGDFLEFLDHDGRVIKGDFISGAVKVRVNIQSLLDFNVENNFATTAKYQFVAGDTLRIYDDGEGNLFTPGAGGFMDYEIQGTNWDEAVSAAGAGLTANQSDAVKNGASFIIPFDNRLLALKDKKGFWIELIRPKDFDAEEPFHEICGMYPVVNGELKILNGVLDTWDTYYQTRIIKIKDVGGITFSHPFESSAVTDYWGAGCDSSGRLHVRDEQAKQTWYPDDVIKSDSYVNEGRVNGLGMFRQKNRKQFKGQEMGGIIGMHAERNVVAFVCENDWFLTDYNMNYARVTAEGLILATLDQNLSEPHQKIGSNFGCEVEHKSAIIYEDGLVLWPCAAEGGYIIMDYSKAENIAKENNEGYFSDKFKFVTQWNRALPKERYAKELIDVVTGYDPKYRDIVITFRPRRGLVSDVESFLNEEREIKIRHQETIVFNLDLRKWVRFTAYCPEFYGTLRHANSGMELISFTGARIWLHNSTSTTTFNNVYGRDTETVLAAVYNHDPTDVKVFQGLMLESNGVLWSVDRIRTQEKDSFSYIPPKHFQKRNGQWFAWLLRDMSSYPNPDKSQAFRKMIFDGKSLFGQWLFIRLVADTSHLGEYVELNNIWIRTTMTQVKK